MAATENRPGRPEQRQRFVRGAADFVRAEGVAAISLRPLAAHLGTSDRMLLYYFGSREHLITEVLDEVGLHLQDALVSGVPGATRVAPGTLLATVWRLLKDPALDADLRLYLEVDALAARGQQPFLTVAERVTASWRDWLRDHIDLPPRQCSAAAAALLAIVDGLLIQRLMSDAAAADAAARWLAASLSG